MTYDGFEDGTTDVWTESGTGGSTITVEAAAKKFGVYGCRFTTDGDGDNQYKRLYVDGLDDATGNYYTWIRVGDVSKGYYFFMGKAGGFSVFEFWIQDSRIHYQSGTANVFTEVPANNTWYRLRATKTGASTVDYRLYDTDDNLLEEHLDIAAEGAGNLTLIRLQIHDTYAGADTIDFDNTCYSDTAEPGPPPAAGQHLNMKGYW